MPYAHQAAGWVTVEHIPSPCSMNNNRTGNPYVATSPVPKSSSASGNPYVNVSPVPTKIKTSPNVTDAALARLAQGTKVFEEGPVIGTLYLSTARIAFCSDNPLCRNISNGQQEWAYYKVVVPLDQLRAVNPSANPRNPSDKYIKIVTMSNHKFWFMGFISYEKALKNLREALQFLLRAFSPMQPLVSARSLSTHLIRIYLHFGQSSMTLQNL
ncbi:hypothetical protein C4D60_Mb11t10100 [Musa balbisiana]|uniref:GRAM domain-containing protein n=1 Tax=Musa balbisiana TaxID=52838 RepID=A0A4S8J5I6_MUSBA|nr:hypothetical protein C4D60_Mb11t10100 [Musa balbisiana]